MPPHSIASREAAILGRRGPAIRGGGWGIRAPSGRPSMPRSLRGLLPQTPPLASCRPPAARLYSAHRTRARTPRLRHRAALHGFPAAGIHAAFRGHPCPRQRRAGEQPKPRRTKNPHAPTPNTNATGRVPSPITTAPRTHFHHTQNKRTLHPGLGVEAARRGTERPTAPRRRPLRGRFAVLLHRRGGRFAAASRFPHLAPPRHPRPLRGAQAPKTRRDRSCPLSRRGSR